jgi:hypothetical protein
VIGQYGGRSPNNVLTISVSHKEVSHVAAGHKHLLSVGSILQVAVNEAGLCDGARVA